MKLNINEKKALYTFGCPNHRATVDRLQLLAAITPDPVAGELFNDLAIKLSTEEATGIAASTAHSVWKWTATMKRN